MKTDLSMSRHRTDRARPHARIALLTIGLIAAAGMADAPRALADDAPARPAANDPAQKGAPLDVSGTWFVLIHYRDIATANPDATRWADRVWTFEKDGRELAWTEYPIVVFEDTTGRFESRQGNARARTLIGWEPTETQLETINGGPRVNKRGAKIKELKGSDKRGWESGGRMAARSAFSVGYREDVSVQSLDALPVFKRSDVMGTAATAKQEGMTVYEVTDVLEDGQILVGRYQRDESQAGVFRMWRTPPPRDLLEKEGTVNERMQQRAAQEFERRLREGDPEAQRLMQELMKED